MNETLRTFLLAGGVGERFSSSVVAGDDLYLQNDVLERLRIEGELEIGNLVAA